MAIPAELAQTTELAESVENAEQISSSTPVVAIIGRPNVGKSTLFNVLTRSKDALVYDQPGVTRDRIFGYADFRAIDGQKSQQYLLIDTGGIEGDDIDNSDSIDQAMSQQSYKAAEESDLILWVVDARSGLTASDYYIAEKLRLLSKPVVLVANKIDGINADIAIAELYSLGIGTIDNEILAISASNKRGISSLLDSVYSKYLSQYYQVDDFEDFEDSEDLGKLDNELNSPAPTGPIKVAIIGRPNVGKSTLTNRMLGEERVVVYDQPGTTTDSIYIPLSRQDRDYMIIDTAGVRKRGKIKEVVEKFSIVKTLKAINDANVVVLLIDSSEKLAEQDLHLLGHAMQQGKSLIIACNKWDGLDDDQKERIKQELDRRLVFVKYAKQFFISAKHGTNVGHLWQEINKCYDSVMQPVNTSKLVGILEHAVGAFQPPLVNGRRIKLRFANLVSHYPFNILIRGKQTDAVPAHYKRYLASFFQEKLNIIGTPVTLSFKTDDNPYAGIRNKLTPRQQYKRERMIKRRKSISRDKKKK